MKSLSVFLLIVAMGSVQGGASLGKQLFPVVGAAGATVFRLIFATLIMFAVWKPWKTKLTLKELKAIFLYGASLGCMNFLFYLSLEKIPLGIAVALEFTGPLAVALFASRKPTDFIWATLAVLGVFLVLPLSPSSSIDFLGVFFALGAGFFWALYILFGQRASAHGGTAAALGMFVAAFVATPVGIFQAGKLLMNWELWPIAIAMAVLSSALPYSLEIIALKQLPAKTFGILMSLEPALAALCGKVFLAEELSSIQWIAIASIISASVGSALGLRQEQTVSSSA